MFNYFKKTYTDKNGIVWIWLYKWYLRPIFTLSTKIQFFLYKRHIYWHNTLKNECTPGFECCDKNMIPKDIQRQKKLKKVLKRF